MSKIKKKGIKLRKEQQNYFITVMWLRFLKSFAKSFFSSRARVPSFQTPQIKNIVNAISIIDCIACVVVIIIPPKSKLSWKTQIVFFTLQLYYNDIKVLKNGL